MTRLVIVEGIPGSGKTTTAHFVADWLAQNGMQPRLHLEGDLDHPADYESIACLPADLYRRLLDAYPKQRADLHSLAVERGGETFISYRKLSSPPPGLLAELAARDVYELPLEDWQRVTRDRWEEFARSAISEPYTYVFECCFLQNLLTTPLARFDQPEDEAAAHVLRVARALKPLSPVLIYLDPPSVRETLERVAAERPREWLDFVTAYTAGQAWGQARGLGGFDGMVRFYQARRDLERSLFPALQRQGFAALWLERNGQDWQGAYQRLRAFLHASMDHV